MATNKKRMGNNNKKKKKITFIFYAKNFIQLVFKKLKKINFLMGFSCIRIGDNPVIRNFVTIQVQPGPLI